MTLEADSDGPGQVAEAQGGEGALSFLCLGGCWVRPGEGLLEALAAFPSGARGWEPVFVSAGPRRPAPLTLCADADVGGLLEVPSRLTKRVPPSPADGLGGGGQSPSPSHCSLARPGGHGRAHLQAAPWPGCSLTQGLQSVLGRGSWGSPGRGVLAPPSPVRPGASPPPRAPGLWALTSVALCPRGRCMGDSPRAGRQGRREGPGGQGPHTPLPPDLPQPPREGDGRTPLGTKVQPGPSLPSLALRKMPPSSSPPGVWGLSPDGLPPPPLKSIRASRGKVLVQMGPVSGTAESLSRWAPPLGQDPPTGCRAGGPSDLCPATPACLLSRQGWG